MTYAHGVTDVAELGAAVARGWRQPECFRFECGTPNSPEIDAHVHAAGMHFREMHLRGIVTRGICSQNRGRWSHSLLCACSEGSASLMRWHTSMPQLQIL